MTNDRLSMILRILLDEPLPAAPPRWHTRGGEPERFAWENRGQVGTSKTGLPLYRYYDPTIGQQRVQHSEPGTGRRPGPPGAAGPEAGRPRQQPAHEAAGRALRSLNRADITDEDVRAITSHLLSLSREGLHALRDSLGIDPKGLRGAPRSRLASALVGHVTGHGQPGGIGHARRRIEEYRQGQLDAAGLAKVLVGLKMHDLRALRDEVGGAGGGRSKAEVAGKVEAAARPPAHASALTKEQAKALVASLPAPGRLPEAHGLYFNAPEGTRVVPLDRVRSTRARPEGIANAGRFMEAARRGLMPKRDPVKVVMEDDGTYTVADGNSTFANAKQSGWSSLPVTLVSREYLQEERKKTVAKEEKKAHDKLNSHSLLHEHERALPRSAPSGQQSEEALFHAAAAAKPEFDRLLDRGEGIEQALGARALHPATGEDFDRALEAMRTTPGPFVLVAGLKGAQRAREKVGADYGGDWSRLHDVVRATVAVDRVAELPRAVEALRQSLAARGWQLHQQPKNKFESPTSAGYRDLNFVVRSPEGVTGEVQFNTKALLRAKQVEGHKLYEEARTIEARARSEGRDLRPEERTRFDALEQQMAQAYERAWHVSLGVAHDDEPDSPAGGEQPAGPGTVLGPQRPALAPPPPAGPGRGPDARGPVGAFSQPQGPVDGGPAPRPPSGPPPGGRVAGVGAGVAPAPPPGAAGLALPPGARPGPAGGPKAPSHQAVARLHQALAGSNLPPEQQARYAEAIDRATRHMPAAALDRAHRNLKGAHFHPDTQAIPQAMIASAKMAATTPEERAAIAAAEQALASGNFTAGGGYCRGELHVDGDYDLTGGGRDGASVAALMTGRHGAGEGGLLAHEVYAHELGHAIDGAGDDDRQRLSASPEWQEAWSSELRHDPLSSGAAPLTAYGGSSLHEGLAEFARLLYGSEVGTEQIARQFPRCAAFFRQHGLWPAERQGAAGAEVAEVFDRRIGLGGSDHIDTLKQGGGPSWMGGPGPGPAGQPPAGASGPALPPERAAFAALSPGAQDLILGAALGAARGQLRQAPSGATVEAVYRQAARDVPGLSAAQLRGALHRLAEAGEIDYDGGPVRPAGPAGRRPAGAPPGRQEALAAFDSQGPRAEAVAASTLAAVQALGGAGGAAPLAEAYRRVSGQHQGLDKARFLGALYYLEDQGALHLAGADGSLAGSASLGAQAPEAFRLPEGYRPPSAHSSPNKALPHGARPRLSREQANAATWYSAGGFRHLNEALYRGQSPTWSWAGLKGAAHAALGKYLPGREGAHLASAAQSPGRMHQALQGAFAQAAPFAEPVRVHRGLFVRVGPEQRAFVEKMRQAAAANGIVRLAGYQSASTRELQSFEGSVRLEVLARHGLDLRPYSNAPHEDELLLNHNSAYRVHHCEQDAQGRWHVRLEQVLERQGAAPESGGLPASDQEAAALQPVRKLGGSTGAQLVRDRAGHSFVVKKGASAEHLHSESAADRAYQALGVPVPEHRVYQGPEGRPVKVARFIEGVPLGQYLRTASPEDARRVKAELQKGLVADALLGNWDVIGQESDNVLVTPRGPVRIDNGGSLEHRAQGARKRPDQFGPEVTEVDTLRDPRVNPTAARVFAGVTDQELRRQVGDIQSRREALLAALPGHLRDTIARRLDWLVRRYQPEGTQYARQPRRPAGPRRAGGPPAHRGRVAPR